MSNWLGLGIFVAAAITDFLDGYLARARNQASDFGRFLDPVADKLLIAATLLLLAVFGRMSTLTVIPAVIILSREFLISGLREFLAGRQIEVPVSKLAKWKTTVQMMAIGFLLVGDAGPTWMPVRMIGEIGLWIAAALTIFTGVAYFRATSRQFTSERSEPQPGE